jgi:hypothetical protein
VGRKTKEWEAARRVLKTKFGAAGIITCELGYRGCWHDNALSFAHARKRLDLQPGELSEVILACTPCHDVLERMPKPVMYQAVQKVINSRKDFQKKILQPSA